MDNLKDILSYFNQNIRDEILKSGGSKNVTEIRLRAGRNIAIRFGKVEQILSTIITVEDILGVLVGMSKHSLYSVQNDINKGFLTIKGGHRVGITGQVVMEGESIKNIKNINGMNIRVARQVKGCSDKIIESIIDSENVVKNTLIVSPPGCGKTTILRDSIRKISDKGKNVGVIDERGEIAAVYNGLAELDIGARTDCISFCPKHIGIKMLIRSMGVDVIATDEIGSIEDISAIREAALSGVNFLFTMHGSSFQEVLKNKWIKELIDEGIFDTIVILSNRKGVGTVEDIYTDISKSKITIEDIDKEKRGAFSVCS